MQTFALDEAKFKELVLYIVTRGADDPAMGATKLNKVLYYSDFLAYAEFGRPITGATYQRLQNGPAPRQLLPIRDQLVETGDAVLVSVPAPKGPQDRLYARRSPDLSLFTATEISLVDAVMERLRYYDASHVSALSHREIGWRLTAPGETIPYSTVFISSDELPDEAFTWAQAVAREEGLLDERLQA